MKVSKTDYTEIARAQVTDSRSIVISDCSRGGYTIAQQMKVKDDGKEITVFMKGAFHINDLSGLYNLRDTLNLVIDTVENRDEDWDE